MLHIGDPGQDQDKKEGQGDKKANYGRQVSVQELFQGTLSNICGNGGRIRFYLCMVMAKKCKMCGVVPCNLRKPVNQGYQINIYTGLSMLT